MRTHVDIRPVKSANDIGRSTGIEKLDHELDDILLTSGDGLEGLDITKWIEIIFESI